MPHGGTELQLLKFNCIDSKSFQIKVEHGKGKKERFTLLPKQLLEDLREYFRQHRPKVYLFEGRRAGKPMSAGAIQHAVRMLEKFKKAIYHSNMEQKTV